MLKLAAVGDIHFGRGVAEAISSKGTFYPFEKLPPIFRQVDIGFANLETPFTTHGVPFVGKDEQLTFHADPSLAIGLQQAGINLVSLANNHITDYGQVGLMETIKILDELGIQHIGAGKNLGEATRPAIFTIDDLTAAFLAFNAYLPFCTVATSENFGVAPFDVQLMKQAITYAQSKSDLVILSIHWGLDYNPYPIPSQRRIIFDVVNMGVSLVLGHHPHIIQGIEAYADALIVFSMGDFLFDEPFKATKESFIFSCQFDQKGIKDYDIVPTHQASSFQLEVDGNEQTNYIQHLTKLTIAYQTMNRDTLNELNRKWIIINLRWLLISRSWQYFLKAFGFSGLIWALWLTLLKKISPHRKNFARDKVI
jgi:poly-gamma-glutamate synthesis protein (capsule biosynthesis protein)